MTISFQHTPGEVRALVQFFRSESPRLRSLTRVVVTPQKTVVDDINRDSMEFLGLTFGDAALEALLEELGVVYDADLLKKSGAQGRSVEYPVSARFPWGWERVSG
ncbi:MAG: hypothetical protein ACE145_02385 [Terriglobia bacterium]